MARTTHAAAVAKQSRAIALLDAGHSYDQIAAELGYANRGSAWRAVDRGLRSQRDSLAGEYLQLAVDRLDAILAAHWGAATEGHDAGAAHLVLDVLAQLDRLLGLSNPAKKRAGANRGEPLGVVLTPRQRAEWEAAGSPRCWTPGQLTHSPKRLDVSHGE